MTKSDYEAIGRAFRKQWHVEVASNGKASEQALTVHKTAIRLGYALERRDSRFNMDKFLYSCGVQKTNAVKD